MCCVEALSDEAAAGVMMLLAAMIMAVVVVVLGGMDEWMDGMGRQCAIRTARSREQIVHRRDYISTCQHRFVCAYVLYV